MINFTLELQDIDYNIIESKNITINKGDKLILKPLEPVSREQMQNIYDYFIKVFNEEIKVAVLPHYCELSVLKMS